LRGRLGQARGDDGATDPVVAVEDDDRVEGAEVLRIRRGHGGSRPVMVVGNERTANAM
jgi:hypothetical protein